MFKYILVLFIGVFFISCALKEAQTLQSHQKSFEQEDSYILFALRAEQIKDYKAASELFDTLYEKSDKKEYLYRSLENDLVAKRSEALIKKVDLESKEKPYDPKLMRFKVVALFELGRLDEAKSLSVELAKRTQEANDYLLTSDIYIKRQEYDLALRYLDSAYAKENNEKILDKMSIILYVNLDRKKDAIANLETHSRMLGCSTLVCNRLIGFYSNENNIEGLLSTYLRLYELNKNQEIAKKIIQIYSYKRDYVSLTKFLENSKSNDEVLLQLYSSTKNYEKAYPLADKLYIETFDVDYLGQSAIYEYENSKDKSSKKLLESVVKKLEKVVEVDAQAIYLNYLGYILIDHDVDVKKGMSYIDKVLQQEPNSAFYLDSKAWGYYKLGECQKASKLMQRVVKLEGGDDPEVLFHIKAIQKCIKQDKGK
ncbi:MAG: hypothetical protein U9N39_04290 [Campylobacterota bacterium]|nr:hypothetical protein [Campylobacterota bacterium]